MRLYKLILSWEQCFRNDDYIYKKNERDIEEEIENFKSNYSIWAELNPDIANKERNINGNRTKLEPDIAINLFRNSIEYVIEEANRLNWPWEWCYDISSGGRFFNPFYVILGDSEIYNIEKGRFIIPMQDIRDGAQDCRYKVPNMFYGEHTNINLAEFVCNYFRKKPLPLHHN